MPNPNHDIARAFFAALGSGALPAEMFTDDVTFWTSGSGAIADPAYYRRGVALLAEIANGGLHYAIVSLTAEEDRVVAEVRSAGTLSDGQAFGASYLFLLRIRDGRIRSVVEHVEARPVAERIMPLLTARMQGAGAG